MKTILTLLIVFAAGYISAQIPNNGFEDWEAVNGAEEPTGWNTNNIQPFGVSVERTNDRWYDEYGMRVRSNHGGIEGRMPGYSETTFIPTEYYKKITFWAKVISIVEPGYVDIAVYQVQPSGYQKPIGSLKITETKPYWDQYSVYFESWGFIYPLVVRVSAYTVSSGTYFYGFAEWIVDDLQLGFSGVANDPLGVSEFKIFPNPADKSFMLSLPEGTNTNEMRIEMYDMSGKMVHSQKINAIQTRIDVADLPSGNYSLAILNKEAIITKQITLK